MIRFTFIGLDREGRDIIVLGVKANHVAIGLNLLAKLRSDPNFIEAKRLPGERVEKAAA